MGRRKGRKMVLKTKDQLSNKVYDDYMEAGEEWTELYLEGIEVKMTKKEFMEAYEEIQDFCNGDMLVRLKQMPKKAEGLTGEELRELIDYDVTIPEEWGKEMVEGDAAEILKRINKEKEANGPIFARICFDDNSELLDLVFGQFEIEK